MWFPFKRKIQNKMTSKIIGTIIRQILTVAGAGGFFSGDELEQMIGATSIIISLIWGIIEKRNRKS